MKYPNAAAFRKHLRSAAPDHLCNLYLIGVCSEYERRFWMKQVMGYMAPGLSLEPISCKDHSFSELVNQVLSPSLFSIKAPICLDHVDILKKNEIELFLKALGPRAVLGASKATPIAAHIQREGVTLELFAEKPWEKEQRIFEEIDFQIHSSGKRISKDVLKSLIFRTDKELATLEKEIEKLICYVGERIDITIDDLHQIVPITAEQSAWSMVEEQLWDGKISYTVQARNIDATFFFGWLSLARSQLSLGLKLASLLEKKIPAHELRTYFPGVWPKTLEKKQKIANLKGAAFFKKGLETLFQIEVMAKDNVNSYSALIEFFQSKIHT